VSANRAIFLEIHDLARSASSGAYNKDVDELDWEALSRPLELRNWHPGDELQQPGRASQKIKTLFQEFRVPIWERQPWPVLTSGNEIVWTRSFGAADKYRLRNASRYALRVYETEGSGVRMTPEQPQAESRESKRSD